MKTKASQPQTSELQYPVLMFDRDDCEVLLFVNAETAITMHPGATRHKVGDRITLDVADFEVYPGTVELSN